MGIDNARQHDSTAKIDPAGAWTNELANGLIRADSHDGVAAHRQRLHHAAACILRVDLAVKQHEIGRRRCRRGGRGNPEHNR